MTAARVFLLLTGLWLGWLGITALLDLSPTDLASIAIWFTGGILLHDALFAPLSAAVGRTTRHLLPPTWWAPTACAAICTTALLLISLPVLNRHNAIPTNPTVLDRNYPLALTLTLLLIWTAVPLAHTTRRISRGRHPEPTIARPPKAEAPESPNS
ncbi:hypothetical protein OG874_34235 [Nocardia sp. NBC_00565]|uniref:hypothetical protein n=1 Tax=Nocardia sp. NBC_00565 TaxID=2975993 RepID=UPI002E8099E3|nr:hypothetical protein [Nocardia sp. NBC_00565]WUC01781.1 hypothetical protein OG874_34235 [Nocardia sp. NBC_00565]